MQYLASIAIHYRFIFMFSDRVNWYFETDQRNFEMMIRGIVVVGNSMFLSILNVS